MRMYTFVRGGFNLGGITNDGGVVDGRVFLAQDPLLNREAATKNYVDTRSNDISANYFSKGTLAHAHIPAFTGTVTKALGGTVITINPTGLDVGTYTKVEVSSERRVIGAGQLNSNDIPVIPYSKVQLGRPTTVEGYGIINALKNTGGVALGAIQVTVPQTEPEHAITKLTVDTALDSVFAEVGEVALFAQDTFSNEYLPLDGSEVTEATHPELYGKLGGVTPTQVFLPTVTHRNSLLTYVIRAL